MTVRILFLNAGDKPVDLSTLQSTGASGTVSSLLWVAKGITELGYSAAVLHNADSSHIDCGIAFHGIGSHDIAAAVSRIPHDVLVVVGHSGRYLQKGRISQRPTIYWVHNWVDLRLFGDAMQKGHFEELLFVSKYHLIRSLADVGMPRFLVERSQAIANPVHTAGAERKINYALEASDTLRVAFCGYPSANKGFPQACEVVNSLASDGINATLSVFGDASLYSADGRGDSSVGCADEEAASRLIWRGTLGRHALYQEMIKHDIIVGGLTGSETFCVSLAEAQTLGVPVLSSVVGGQTDFVQSGITGLLTRSNGRAVSELRKFSRGSSDKRKCMGDAAMAAMAKYDYRVVAKSWAALLESVSSSGSAAQPFGRIELLGAALRVKINRKFSNWA
ncbi:glycosyltransferase [Chitinasiproducens palmae]|uniref:Glycosyltransferase involved in cell wall bisynthesis n=1 Tax=Chitinasiproducens palmae TaxID=1770053 RepID=A0A1H2PQF2_9BURK|nr:glycosyltransferase [Chitinasiproducens palmae]SDV48610.1 Glycosyltransferase involved in cell wall bisynthesis [Chitinasiproducens palmae]